MDASGQGWSPREQEGGALIVHPGGSDPAGQGEQQLQAAGLQQATAAHDVEALLGDAKLRAQSAGGSAAAGSELPPTKRQRNDALLTSSALQPEQAASALFTAFPAGGSTLDPSLISVGSSLTGTVDAISNSSTYFVTLNLAGVDFKGALFCPPPGFLAGSGSIAVVKAEPTPPIKRPRTAYNFFSDAARPGAKERNPNLDQKGISKMVGEMWAQLPIDEKERYYAAARRDKERYEQELLAHQARPRQGARRDVQRAQQQHESQRQGSGAARSEGGAGVPAATAAAAAADAGSWLVGGGPPAPLPRAAPAGMQANLPAGQGGWPTSSALVLETSGTADSESPFLPCFHPQYPQQPPSHQFQQQQQPQPQPQPPPQQQQSSGGVTSAMLQALLQHHHHPGWSGGTTSSAQLQPQQAPYNQPPQVQPQQQQQPQPSIGSLLLALLAPGRGQPALQPAGIEQGELAVAYSQLVQQQQHGGQQQQQHGGQHQ
ncbi:hypothetical protein ABPG75_007750 [Micractinium tetrahymenae]